MNALSFRDLEQGPFANVSCFSPSNPRAWSPCVTTLDATLWKLCSFTIAGATSGALQSNGAQREAPGIPAKVLGTVLLCGGSIVYIVVGQQGGTAADDSLYTAGGGGGTFVFVQSLLQPLVVGGTISSTLCHQRLSEDEVS